jgi:hypothetical protein
MGTLDTKEYIQGWPLKSWTSTATHNTKTLGQTVFYTWISLYHSTQQHAKQHANNQQQIQYQDSVHQVTNAAILNLDFNLYDKIISFRVLHILQIQMFYKLLLRQVYSSGPLNMQCEVY